MCGVCGVYGSEEAANFCYLMNYALQHRGQESSGIGVSDGSDMHLERRMGWVAQGFTRRRLQKLKGHIGQGHNRYSTQGSSSLRNAQPFLYDKDGIQILLSHNGNLVEIDETRELLKKEGSEFKSKSDSEVLLHLIGRADGKTLEEKVLYALTQPEQRFSIPKGAYAIVVNDHETLVGITNGFRPLVLGKFNGAHVLASETVALDLIGAEVKYHLGPGDLVVINKDGPKIREGLIKEVTPPCIFEDIYFARPDSFLWGDPQTVHTKRKALGAQLAKEYRAAGKSADVVFPVPDSGESAAIGFAEESGIRYDKGITRNHYIGRTFIEPEKGIRHFGLKVKLNPIGDVLYGKRVVVVDDSIVRANTSKKIIKELRRVGATEVDLAVSSPPINESCYYGMDTPTRKELIAAYKTIVETRDFIGADNLIYLSREGMLKVLAANKEYCTACFVDGIHPIEFRMPNGMLSTQPRERFITIK